MMIEQTAGAVIRRLRIYGFGTPRDRAVIACLERAGYVEIDGPADASWWAANLPPEEVA